MKNLPQLIRFWLPVVIWALVIFLFSSKQTGVTSEVHWQDVSIKKTGHMLEYALLSLLTFRALLNSGYARAKSLKYAFILCVLYAITDEFHQRFTFGRESTLRDVIFDTIGAGTTIFLLWKYLPKMPKRLQKLAASFHLISLVAK